MAEELDSFAVKAGVLPRTDFKDEQDRLNVYAAALLVSSQAGESIKGEKGEAGPAGPPGQGTFNLIEQIPVPVGSISAVATSGSLEGAIVQLKKTGTFPDPGGSVGIGTIAGAGIGFVFSGGFSAIPDATYFILVYKFVSA